VVIGTLPKLALQRPPSIGNSIWLVSVNAFDTHFRIALFRFRFFVAKNVTESNHTKTVHANAPNDVSLGTKTKSFR